MTLSRQINSGAIQELLNIMSRLRDPTKGCPWDNKQTWQSLFPFTLEEVYEVGAAIDANNPVELCDELGDLLFQIVFYSQIAKEQGHFDINTVAEAICKKMIRRHPHVFSGKEYASEAAQKADWETIKQQERELLAEMKSCPTCLEKYSKEKAFRAFIRSKVSRKKVSPTLIQSIKDKIRHSSI